MIDRPKGYFPVPAFKYPQGAFLDFMRGVLDSEACRARGVNIVDFQPVERPADGAHRSWDIHITATGAFPAFVEALAAIEVISPYAALRELAVTATPDQPSPTRISWTIRVTWAAAPSAKTETRP